MTDKVSYALGLSIGNNFRASGIRSLVTEDFVAGVEAVFNETKPEIEYEEAQKVLNEFFQRLQNQEAELNLKAGREFMEIQKNKSGVTTLENGIQYEVFKRGEGEKPSAQDTVRVHYHGTLIDGTIFDSSVQRGTPAEFPLRNVIPGWTYILQQMPVGSKWKVTIPSELAYGERGAGQNIRPNMTLIFEIELLDIIKK
ncbi:MAG: FKBP-type peptidyl-prolyl cis-trans isomerase [Porphyromonas sp.]|nr:FKBP-type peptidyl-prolyl cis-trans isomerase [Porphyromonas sp.]